MTNSLAEFSVVYTERALNHMSPVFMKVMRDLSDILTQTYRAEQAVIVPGGGTYAMESVARQFISPQTQPLIIRNGWFSYRWSQIIEACQLGREPLVVCAKPTGDDRQARFYPAPIDEVIAIINQEKPDIVFAPHVETAAGMRLQDDYTRQIGEAVHQYGGLFVLDCIASGADWVNMQQMKVDILISAPQKSWSAPPCAGFVMLGQRAIDAMKESHSNSFANDLKQWQTIMQAYLDGGHAYHATMPTDALLACRDVMQQSCDYGLNKLADAQMILGQQIRRLLKDKGFITVAGDGWESDGVIVCHTDDINLHNGSAFKAQGLQIAAGVPLACGESADYQTFRIGLFGIDKWQNVDKTVTTFKTALDAIVK